MNLLKISLLAILFVVAVSCSNNKDQKEESKSKSEDKSMASDSVMPMVEDYADDSNEKGYEEDESAVDGEPVPGAEIYLEQEPVGEE